MKKDKYEAHRTNRLSFQMEVSGGDARYQKPSLLLGAPRNIMQKGAINEDWKTAKRCNYWLAIPCKKVQLMIYYSHAKKIIERRNKMDFQFEKKTFDNMGC